jgi:DNA gyrase subunit A
VTNAGTLVRTRVDEVSVVSRNTQGVRLIKLANKENLVGVTRIQGLGDDDEGAEATADEANESDESGEPDDEA